MTQPKRTIELRLQQINTLLETGGCKARISVEVSTGSRATTYRPCLTWSTQGMKPLTYWRREDATANWLSTLLVGLQLGIFCTMLEQPSDYSIFPYPDTGY